MALPKAGLCARFVLRLAIMGKHGYGGKKGEEAS